MSIHLNTGIRFPGQWVTDRDEYPLCFGEYALRHSTSFQTLDVSHVCVLQ